MARRIVIINEHAPTLDAREGIRKVPAHALQPGDVTSANGERVVLVKRATDNADRVEVVLAKNGLRRHLHWNRNVLVGIVARDTTATPKSFWSYQSSTETPSLAEAIKLGAISGNTTQEKWDQLSPGMRREIVRSHNRRTEGKDGVGSPEEVAYGEGWHSTQRGSPYDDPALTTAWERGRKAKQQQGKMISGYFQGEVRGKRFDPPKARQADFKSEKGYVAKLIDARTGGLLARSEPHISNGAGLKAWMQTKARELIAQGKRVKAEIGLEFYDPDLFA